MNGIHWIASYPRSGSTWFRLILSAAMAGGSEFRINDLSVATMRGVSRKIFDELTGVAAADLTPQELLAWRPAMARDLVAHSGQSLVAKTHDACLPTPAGESPIPPEITLGTVYLVRDPRDVVLSLARHMDIAVDAAIAVMATRDRVMAASRRALRRQLPEIWSAWDAHVDSWTLNELPNTRVLRFEELHRGEIEPIRLAAAALGLDLAGEAIEAALERTRLDRLRAQEREGGFVEALGPNRFFGSGLVGGWRERLTREQIARIEADHGATMRRLGYLD